MSVSGSCRLTSTEEGGAIEVAGTPRISKSCSALEESKATRRLTCSMVMAVTATGWESRTVSCPLLPLIAQQEPMLSGGRTSQVDGR
jgi:hypothetical protein